MMTIRKLVPKLVMVAGLAVWSCLNASAATLIPLAQFKQAAGDTSTPFHYLQNAAGTNDGTFSVVDAPVVFSFQIPAPAGFSGNKAAFLNITGVATGPLNAGVPGLNNQNVDITSLTLTSGLGGTGTLYLSMTSIAPSIFSPPGGALGNAQTDVAGGTTGSRTGSIIGDTGTGQPIVYASDAFTSAFLNSGADKSYNLGLNALFPFGFRAEDAAANDFADFDSQITGQFSFTNVSTVPEPSSLAMLFCAGVGGSLFAIRRRRI